MDDTQSSPLLSIKASPEPDYSPVKTFQEGMSVCWKETVKLWKVAAPVAFTTLFQFLIQSVTTIFIGHLGDLELSAISLAHNVINAIAYGFLLWYVMSVNILVGVLPNAVIALGSFSICTNFQNWELMLLVGVNAAISIRVSNELGKGHPRTAKYSVCVVVLHSLMVGILYMITIFLTRNYIPIIFTGSEDMQRAVARLAYLLGVTMLLNSATQVLTGVAVGGGWQVMVAYINLGCYYLFGLPLAILLGFKAKLGAMGLWGGMMSGSALQILFLLILTSRTNWDNEVKETTKRIKKWGNQEKRTDQEDNLLKL